MKEYRYKDTESVIKDAIETVLWIRDSVPVCISHQFHPVSIDVYNTLFSLRGYWEDGSWTNEHTRQLRSIKGKIAQNKSRLLKILHAQGICYSGVYNGWYKKADGYWAHHDHTYALKCVDYGNNDDDGDDDEIAVTEVEEPETQRILYEMEWERDGAYLRELFGYHPVDLFSDN